MMITDNPEERISVEGHTDNIGNASYNVGLSERRAGAVVKYLTENGWQQIDLKPKVGEKPSRW
jgi:OOP family OmpA-OmpF porin